MRQRTFAALIVALPLVATAGCSTNLFAPPPMQAPPPQVPVAPAYLHAEVIGGYAARAKKARAARIKPLTPNLVLDFVGRQEADLRRQTAGTGVEVIRSGDRILVRLPASGTFDVGKADIKTQALSTVTEIALTLKQFNQSLVDVLGHTDPTGSPASNQSLSERRAQAVAAHLKGRGVASARIATRGFAATQPIADNSTDSGRALNRRVEIKLVPLR